MIIHIYCDAQVRLNASATPRMRGDDEQDGSSDIQTTGCRKNLASAVNGLRYGGRDRNGGGILIEALAVFAATKASGFLPDESAWSGLVKASTPPKPRV